MWRRMLAGAALLAAPAVAHQLPPGSSVPPAAVEPAPDPAPGPEADPLAITEADLRMTVPVSIAGGAAWPFIIDTGSERTVVSSELARRLNLPRGPMRRVLTMGGAVAATTALVPNLRVGPVSIALTEAPVFARRNLGAIGMLGIDALQGHKVSIDLERQTMALLPSRKRRPPRPARNEIVVVAKSLYGQLIVTDARWRGRKIAVVIDTGSTLTVGNSRLLQIGRKPPPHLGQVEMIAVNGAVIPAELYRLDRLEIGEVSFLKVPVAIADVAPFHRLGLTDRPALLLGMDALRLFQQVDIDFANRSILLKLPRASAMGSTRPLR
ncbi:retroviral-like aspartic protease family protein [Sphingomonas sp. PL-96]|uniref:retropepsin-like aspartic protease n=1 Tax=Sphingomonas sp. PL-96 TaxID=2887201 RepID=UPI001E5A17BD|nr:retropepsin-like aspartic protease [Sphingomonas sp. PL-96]MCC2976923.1 retroviral-like aspartic protease family protein [Sphingomonas sp. PL-96]